LRRRNGSGPSALAMRQRARHVLQSGIEKAKQAHRSIRSTPSTRVVARPLSLSKHSRQARRDSHLCAHRAPTVSSTHASLHVRGCAISDPSDEQSAGRQKGSLLRGHADPWSTPTDLKRIRRLVDLMLKHEGLHGLPNIAGDPDILERRRRASSRSTARPPRGELHGQELRATTRRGQSRTATRKEARRSQPNHVALRAVVQPVSG